MDQAVLVQQFDQSTGTDSQGSSVHSLGRIEEPVRVSHTILRIVSLLLLVAVIGGGFVWWQDQTSLRTKDLIGLTPEHVEVEGADGTTQIHPLDEPEDQAVAEGQTEGATALALPQAETSAEAPAETPATAPAAAPVAPTTPAPAAPVHSAAPVVATPATPAPAVPAVPAPVVTAPVAPSAAAPAPVAAAPTAGQGQVQLQFTADCWTQVTDGSGKVLFSGLKRKGDSLSVNGKPPFAVRLGFARGAQVSYNGQSVDVAPFTSGETARLKLGQ
ncbi:Cytoskeleton protein RodZ [compost metagenome]